eukprot:TRINITY_DN28276_c0_g6_i1.p1 TRINITY_DN28276_c0_g6~~TRINITY_DN28276_c0_g6_i1.p1  ORF type:complete len:128 (-),score=11.87 TRINITY_DN28276_c0_g6_i1:618-1001(-)
MANHVVDESPRTPFAVGLPEGEPIFSDAASDRESLHSFESEAELGLQEHPPGVEEGRTEEDPNAAVIIEKQKRECRTPTDDEVLRAQSLLLAIQTRNAFLSRRRNGANAPREPDTLPVLLNCRRHFH